MSTTKIPNSLLETPSSSNLTVLSSGNLTSQTTTSSTTVPLTNLSISNVNTNGRPVMLQLVSSGTGLCRVSGADAAQIVFLRDGTPISEQHLRATIISPTQVVQTNNPASSFCHIDMFSSSTHTYSVGFKSSSSTGVTVEHVKLVVIVL